MNHATRRTLYAEIEKQRETKVLAFVTGERPGLQTQIAADAVAPIVALLDEIGPTKKISLILHTNGGSVTAAWRIINLIRSFADEVEVIVPDTAMSAGTLIALGANRILMTKQAALGPIDPSLSNHPLAPSVVSPTGQQLKVPVSAEAIRGYIEELKKDIIEPGDIAKIWLDLSSKVHPIVLGEIFRIGQQIRSLAGELISNQITDAAVAEKVIQHLCSDSGSHDYTINRRKAAELGLNIEKPSAKLYEILSSVSKSFHAELQTFVPYAPAQVLNGNQSANYTLIRGIIESTGGGQFGFVSQGTLTLQGQPPQSGAADHRTFEGWKKLP